MLKNEIIYFDSVSPVRYNNGKEYYTIKSASKDNDKLILYFGCFPTAWAEEHENSSIGPINCENCLLYGSHEGVFLGYCDNCQREKDCEIEDSGSSVYTYLNDVNLDFVGEHYVDLSLEEKNKYCFINQKTEDEDEEIREYELTDESNMFTFDCAAGYNSY